MGEISRGQKQRRSWKPVWQVHSVAVASQGTFVNSNNQKAFISTVEQEIKDEALDPCWMENWSLETPS